MTTRSKILLSRLGIDAFTTDSMTEREGLALIATVLSQKLASGEVVVQGDPGTPLPQKPLPQQRNEMAVSR
jgi:hypothetical protein